MNTEKTKEELKRVLKELKNNKNDQTLLNKVIFNSIYTLHFYVLEFKDYNMYYKFYESLKEMNIVRIDLAHILLEAVVKTNTDYELEELYYKRSVLKEDLGYTKKLTTN